MFYAQLNEHRLPSRALLKILRVDQSPFSYTLNGSAVGHWALKDRPSIATDSIVFAQLTTLIWNSTQLEDESFGDMVLPEIVKLLHSSPLFQFLQSPTIVVTPPHNHLRPFQHILNVANKVRTPSFDISPHQRFVLRMASFTHDLGKGMVAGIPQDQVVQQHCDGEAYVHSYPKHSLLSLLIVERLLIHAAKNHEIIRQVPASAWEQLELVVHNHHHFNFDPQQIDLSSPEITNVITSEELFRSLLLTVAFMYADMTATDAYRCYWPITQERLRQLALTIAELLSPLLISLMLQLANEFPDEIPVRENLK